MAINELNAKTSKDVKQSKISIKEKFYLDSESLLNVALSHKLTPLEKIGRYTENIRLSQKENLTKYTAARKLEDRKKLWEQLRLQQIALEKRRKEEEEREKKQAQVSRSNQEIRQRFYAVITAYTAGVESTGKSPGHPDYGKTASGTKVAEGRTIAMDKSIPFGTKVKIEGFGDQIFIVEDRGGAIVGNKIDLYMEHLSDAQNFGVQTREVTILK